MTYFQSLNYDCTAKATFESFTLELTQEHDADHGEPWKECDGHGPVSDWRPVREGEKRPGELVLSVDHGSARYYDFAAACKLALREGWNAPPYDIPGETKRQKAARAALADYKYLKAWCSDNWHYMGLIVTASKHGIKLASASVWGIESTSGDDYFLEVANDLAADAIFEARAAIESLAA